MKDVITLAGYSFRRENETQWMLEGEYKDAFFLSLKEEEKILQVNLNVGCSCCGGPGPANGEQMIIDLCKGKECRVEDDLCPYQEDGECVEGTSPFDLEWNKMAEDAKKQFPEYKIEQWA